MHLSFLHPVSISISPVIKGLGSSKKSSTTTTTTTATSTSQTPSRWNITRFGKPDTDGTTGRGATTTTLPPMILGGMMHLRNVTGTPEVASDE
ncbi:hypothetical protein HKX48_008223, partial [Thoreauomyces humboldtii]